MASNENASILPVSLPPHKFLEMSISFNAFLKGICERKSEEFNYKGESNQPMSTLKKNTYNCHVRKSTKLSLYYLSFKGATGNRSED